MVDRPSISLVMREAGWVSLEAHLETLTARVDESLRRSEDMRSELRDELLERTPDLPDLMKRPSEASLRSARETLENGTVAASDGTIAPVPLLGGAKIQVGVVIVSNRGDVVDLVTRVFETDLQSGSSSAIDYFTQLRESRSYSNILARAIMLYGERSLLLEHEADWRMVHGELIPFELRTGAGRPEDNLEAAFDLVESYVETQRFLAVSESTNDLDLLNFSILLDHGEYITIRSLREDLLAFLEGNDSMQRANFSSRDANRFRDFIGRVGEAVDIVMVKAGPRPFLLEVHHDRVEEAVALFLADSLWTRGFSIDGTDPIVRGFPFHLDLADQVAGTLFKASDFRSFVEARLFHLDVETGLLDLDPRRTRR